MTEYSTLFHEVRGVSVQCFVELLVWAMRNVHSDTERERGKHTTMVYRAQFVSVPEMTMSNYRFMVGHRLDGHCMSYQTPLWFVEMKVVDLDDKSEPTMTSLSFKGDAIALRRDITALKLEGILT